LSSDGTVWDLEYQPKRVSGLKNVTKIASTGYHSLALKSDGTVWAWGYNDDGQLGDGTTKDRLNPVQTKKLTGIVDISVGDFSSFALQNNGVLWVWGSNAYGQLGDATTKDRLLNPAQIKSVTAIKSFHTSHNAVFAVKTDGTPWAWGIANALGIGSDSEEISATPTQVCGLTNVDMVTGEGGWKRTFYAIGEGKPCMAAVTVSEIGPQTWTGSQLRPKVRLVFSGSTLKEGVDYTISYATNTALGKGSMRFTGKGDYLGSKSVKFDIVPQPTKLTKATPGKKQVSLAWTKATPAQKASGYQLQMRATDAVTWKASNYGVATVSAVKKNLKAGKTYEFRIRTYKKIGKAMYYSAWSAVKTAGKAVSTSKVTPKQKVTMMKWDKTYTAVLGGSTKKVKVKEANLKSGKVTVSSNLIYVGSYTLRPFEYADLSRVELWPVASNNNLVAVGSGDSMPKVYRWDGKKLVKLPIEVACSNCMFQGGVAASGNHVTMEFYNATNGMTEKYLYRYDKNVRLVKAE
jgi:hypothetical protein